MTTETEQWVEMDLADATTVLQRYNAACAAIHNSAPPKLHDALAEVWAQLPLWSRVRIILTPPWRDAVAEIAAAALNRWGR